MFESLEAQIAAHESWARTADRAARTSAGRRAFWEKFEHQVDPDGALAPEVRTKMAESARKAHFRRMALKSARARKSRSQ